MSFKPNPAKFIIGSENVKGRLVLHDSFIDLVFFEKRADDQPWPIKRIFGTNSGEPMRRRWWSFVELGAVSAVGAVNSARIARLTFRGRKFSAALGFDENRTCSKSLGQVDQMDRNLYDAIVASERISIEVPFSQERIAPLVLNLGYLHV